jgi:hypothetical protein
MNLMDAPAPRYIVFDDAPRLKGLGCTADEPAAALRAPLAVVGVRVIRQRGVTSKALFSEFQARGISRRQYDTKAIQVARIVDEVCLLGTHNVRGTSFLRNFILSGNLQSGVGKESGGAPPDTQIPASER